MRPRFSTITTSVSLFVVSAAASTFIEQLPDCWQTCIETRGPQCDDSDLDCLCHFAATPTLLFPTLLPCVRRSCDSEYYPQSLTAPLRTIQTACAATRYSISDIAISKAVHAAEGASSAAVDAGRERGRSATRTRGMKSWHSNAGSTTRGTTSTSASVSVSSIDPPTGAPILSTPAITSTQSSAFSKSTSTPHASNEGGGTPLDVGQQGVGVEKRAGSGLGSRLLGLLATAFVPMVFF